MSSFWSQIAGSAKPVTASDTVNVEGGPVVLYIGVSGNVSVITGSGDTAIFLNAQAGSVLPVSVMRVNATATTATNMLALS